VWGIAGVLLQIVPGVLDVFGTIGPFSAAQFALAAPIGVQELVLAGWLVLKGFSPSAFAVRTA
jgi:hypothetical protein